MVDLPSLDRYDMLAAIIVVAVLAVAFFVYPTRVTKAAGLTVSFTVFFCWLGYFLWKWMYDIEM